MNIARQLLQAGADEDPALLAGAEITTYAELRSRVNDVAAWLLTLGGAAGDRVGLCAENSPFAVAAYLGTLLVGRVAVPLNPEWSASTRAAVLTNAGVRALVVSRRQAARMRREQSGLSLPWACEGDLARSTNTVEAHNVDTSQGLAALMFTSGSTGEPKGVMVTHRNIECNTRDIVDYMGLTSSDRAMLVLPLHYCFGLSVLHTHLWAGGSVVFNHRFLYPETVLQDMQSKACTGLAGVPSTYQILLRKSRFREMSFPALRWLQQAGGRLSNVHIRETCDAFPEVRFYTMYGQTEATARLSYLPPEKIEEKLGSIGRGLPSAQLEVLKADGSPVVAGSDEVGEIVASGGNVCAGYWNDPVETARYFRDGKLFTGDLARVDADGYLFIVDRERDMIKCGGNRVSTKEIEDVLAEMPDVVESAVVGVPDELMGEAIAAFLVCKPGASIDEDQVRLHCRKRLAAYKVPQHCRFVKQLAHNASGKVLKPLLRDQFTRENETEIEPLKASIR